MLRTLLALAAAAVTVMTPTPAAKIRTGFQPCGALRTAPTSTSTTTLGANVARVDPRTNKVVRTVKVGSGPCGVVAGAGFAVGRELRLGNDLAREPAHAARDEADPRRQQAMGRRLRLRRGVVDEPGRRHRLAHRREDEPGRERRSRPAGHRRVSAQARARSGSPRRNGRRLPDRPGDERRHDDRRRQGKRALHRCSRRRSVGLEHARRLGVANRSGDEHRRRNDEGRLIPVRRSPRPGRPRMDPESPRRHRSRASTRRRTPSSTRSPSPAARSSSAMRSATCGSTTSRANRSGAFESGECGLRRTNEKGAGKPAPFERKRKLSFVTSSRPYPACRRPCRRRPSRAPRRRSPRW